MTTSWKVVLCDDLIFANLLKSSVAFPTGAIFPNSLSSFVRKGKVWHFINFHSFYNLCFSCQLCLFCRTCTSFDARRTYETWPRPKQTQVCIVVQLFNSAGWSIHWTHMQTHLGSVCWNKHNGQWPMFETFFWESFPKCGWMGWLIPKQGPKIAFFEPNFTFRFPKYHKNFGVGGWVHTFGIMLKNVSFTPSLNRNGKHTNYFQFSNDGW